MFPVCRGPVLSPLLSYPVDLNRLGGKYLAPFSDENTVVKVLGYLHAFYFIPWK